MIPSSLIILAMKPIGWVLILGSFAFLALLIYIAVKRNNKLIEEGKIIRRDFHFMEKAEEFTLKPVEPARVSEAVKAFDYNDIPASMKGSTEDQIYTFTGSSWGARLKRKEVAEDKVVYRFEFTNWKSSDGSARDEVPMNKLLTDVEKMFLAFDPETKVASVPVEFTTKHKFL